MTTVMVTGAAGFIGSHVTRILLEREEVEGVVAVDNFSTSARRTWSDRKVKVIEGSVCDRPLLEKALHGVHVVIHLAALPSVMRGLSNPLDSHNANATGTLTVMEASRSAGVVHHVIASSSSVFGKNVKQPKEPDDWIHPKSVYAASKAASEMYALAYRETYAMPMSVFRFFNVYGSGQPFSGPYPAVIPAAINAAESGNAFTLEGDGLQTRDFTHVSTVAHSLVEAAMRRVDLDRPLMLALGMPHSVLEMLECVEKVTGKPIQIVKGPARRGDVRDSMAEASPFRDVFPLAPRVDLTEGILEAVTWYRAVVKSR